MNTTHATDAEIAKVVELCVGSWPAGPRGNIWTATLRDAHYSYPTLIATYEHLRDNETRPPTPGRFIDIARQLSAPRRHVRDVLPDYSNAVSRTDAIARLEWKVSTGSATPADIEALDGLLAVARSRHPSAHQPYQPTLTEDQPCQP